MSSYPLLKNAPPHDSPEFIEYLRKNNPVVYEDSSWLVIENCKYHHPDLVWYTAFAKRGAGLFEIDFSLLEAQFGHNVSDILKHFALIGELSFNFLFNIRAVHL